MSKVWYIDEDFFAPYQMAVVAKEEVRPDPERIQRIRQNADQWADPKFASDNMRIENGVAKIDVRGVLLQSSSFIDDLYAKYFGESYATYPGIINQLAIAEAHPLVESIELNVDSPGGDAAGLDAVATILAGCKKPTKAKTSWMAASAAYYLASQADEIVATTPAASFGSIGVVVDMVDATEYFEKIGVRFYSITSSKAPRKRQAPHSDEFKSEMTARLNDLHEIFAQRVSEGRTRATGSEVTTDQVNMNFGQGGLLIAKAAMAVGMIDGIVNVAPKNQEVEVSEAINASQEQLSAAIEQGVQQERTRVASLLPWMGADQDRVLSAIKTGESLTPEMVTELSTKAAEKAVAAAKETATKQQTEAEASVAAAMESDAAPAVSGQAAEGSEGESEEDVFAKAAMAEARKFRKNGGK